MTNIPSYLIKQISKAKTVLVLGAGASVEATDARGNHQPSSKQLGERLADKFPEGAWGQAICDRVNSAEVKGQALNEVLQKAFPQVSTALCPLVHPSFGGTGQSSTTPGTETA